ncbi:molybdopterin molybdotransferase MoeA [Rhodanobacter sp. BL-MT-08]
MPDQPVTRMISASEAEQLIGVHLNTFTTATRSIDEAAGCVLRQPIVAERDQPPFDRVTMDGMAIRLEDFSRGTRRFDIGGMQAAGMPPTAMQQQDACIEVMTGAVMPDGCDTVIAVEQTRREGSQLVIAADCEPQRGQFIHRRGSDCQAGDTLVEAGARLRAPEIAVIAANGYGSVEVSTQPRVTILATGDELVDVEAPVAAWQIRRSNDRALAALLASRGLSEVRLKHVTDDRDMLKAAIAQQLDTRDVLILSGGVSMGQRDFVPGVLSELGVQRVFHKIAQRPGKPMWFGVGPKGQAVFALPGNPVSVLVCATRYVMPALLAAMGRTASPPTRVVLAGPIDFAAALTYFVPVRMQPDAAGLPVAAPMPTQTSGDFSALTQTDGFVELPPERSHFPAGFIATYYPW